MEYTFFLFAFKKSLTLKINSTFTKPKMSTLDCFSNYSFHHVISYEYGRTYSIESRSYLKHCSDKPGLTKPEQVQPYRGKKNKWHKHPREACKTIVKQCTGMRSADT